MLKGPARYRNLRSGFRYRVAATRIGVYGAGSPLGIGMPSCAPLRADGQSHYEAWQAMLRHDPCSYRGRPCRHDERVLALQRRQARPPSVTR